MKEQAPEVLKFFTLFLQMVAAAGAMVLLFALQALITAWSGCVLAMRSLTFAGRNVVHRASTWRQALVVFHLGSASLGLAPVRAEVRVPSTSGSRVTLLEWSGGDR